MNLGHCEFEYLYPSFKTIMILFVEKSNFFFNVYNIK
jgi:hypothetical protein